MSGLYPEIFIRRQLINAYAVACASPDPSTQNGAIVFTGDLREIASGCNTFTPGVTVTAEKLERPLKYQYIEHAERNAVYAAVAAGIPPEVMVCPWASCTECARAVIGSGIRTLIRHKDASDHSPARWLESIAFADDLMRSAGVEIIDYRGHLGARTIRHCGELWTP